MEDKRIIELLFARDESVLRILEERYGSLIVHILKQVLPDREDVEECANDVYLALWNSIPPNNPEFLKAYICKVARNLALKVVRGKNAKKRSTYSEIALEELGECISFSDSPEDIMETKEITRLVNIFIRRLSEENQMLFIRRYFFGDSIEDLSERFKMRANTVSVKLSRIRSSLKEYLEEQEVHI